MNNNYHETGYHETGSENIKMIIIFMVPFFLVLGISSMCYFVENFDKIIHFIISFF